MDKGTRNTLRNAVTKCRKLLEEAIAEVLEGRFGIHRKGSVEATNSMSNLSAEVQEFREQLLVHLEHIKAGGFEVKDAIEQLVREIAFTQLNRLCAYKMMEKQGLIRETVSRGLNSNGFKFYLADHPDDGRLWQGGRQYQAYLHYLEWLGGTLSEEIGVLFSPNDPANKLFPPQRVLEELLGLINSEELADIWEKDEAIGWIYQYFTPKELRDKARKESQAPRNSYELAFRNQFYTPRYVVEFLTDNTLGRTWYEMRKGETSLKERCKYLVIRPNEIFLGPGENAPEEEEDDEELSQEELLKQPVYIQHREKKDPREIKILDPACGSGHFLLYCFNLLMIIYEGAYFDSELGPKLKQSYPTLKDLRLAMPGLILGRNLHGVDIDLRATQIASLALWLRAQRAYTEMGVGREERPRIKRSNIVVAEPMPGEKEMLQEFISGLQPPIIGTLVETVFEKMKLAGEAGSLLKIEEEIKTEIARVKEIWQSKPETVQVTLFGDRVSASFQSALDFAGITDEEFWDEAEARVVEELERYAERAAKNQKLARQLFAEDAAHGFAFIDICRNKYDVVLMNPPFGKGCSGSKKYINDSFPDTKNNLYTTFVERGLDVLLSKGNLGAITSRTGFFLTSFKKWRENIILKKSKPTYFLDLGHGVLDTAMVETAAFCLEGE